MHIHTHFRHHYSFLTSYVISNKKRFLAKKKKKGRLLASRLIQENIPVIATSSPSKRKNKIQKYWIDKIIFSLLCERWVNIHKELRAPSVEWCAINTKHHYNLLLKSQFFHPNHFSNLSQRRPVWWELWPEAKTPLPDTERLSISLMQRLFQVSLLVTQQGCLRAAFLQLSPVTYTVSPHRWTHTRERADLSTLTTLLPSR